MRIAILGYGEMGKSFEKLLAGRASTTIWDKNLDSGEENQPLEQAVEAARAVILAVPAAAVEEIAERIAPELTSNATVFTIAKGITAEARHPLEILREALGDDSVAGIYGPMIGEELQAGQHGFADVAALSEAAWQAARDVFNGTHLRLRRASDPWSAAWAAVAKNIYVPVIGAAAELGLGDNLRGALFANALEEMRGLGAKLGSGGSPLTGLSGAGDLFTTATSDGSHHHEAGRALARGDHSKTGTEGENIRGEGFHSLRCLRERLDPATDEFPLFAAAEALLESPQAFRDALDAWMEDRPLEAR
ncbi:MAG: hypothetical protein R3270_05640 [Gammaproteobacteria bacterium]|nr:hypothetical protein [Gammaproteobacteria bacterium]